MIEVVKYRTDEERKEAVGDAQGRGLIMLTDDFHWTGMLDKWGQPIIGKTMRFGDKDVHHELYGAFHQRGVHQPSLRKAELIEKMQEQDLSNKELNELMRLRA
jgi:hypothetical protein